VNRIASLALAALAATAFLATADVDAKRLGGGKSFGAQRSATPDAPAKSAGPAATPAAPASGATAAGPASNPVMAPGAAAAKGAAPAGAAGAAAGGSRWLAPVAGLAAGLGLAALASYMGFGEELASFLLIALLAVAAIVVVRLLMRRGSTPAARPMPYAGAGAGLGNTPGGYETQVPPAAKFEPVFGGASPAKPVTGKTFPPGFDPVAFAREARKQFLAVQSAHDRQDASALADVMTPELYREIAREIETSGAARPTQIVDVAAEVVDVATEGREHWVSVRFTGTAREGGSDEAFDEMWNLVKPVDGTSGWLIGGIQQVVARA